MVALDPAHLSFRACTRADFPLLFRWFHEPHAARWFGRRAATLGEVEAEYGSYVDGSVPIHVYIVTFKERPIGMMQWERFGDFEAMMRDYRVDDRDACNCDVLIGERDFVHRGLGAAMILRFLREVVFVNEGITQCLIDPEVENAIAIRVYARAGFRFAREVKDDEGVPIHLMELSRADLERATGG